MSCISESQCQVVHGTSSNGNEMYSHGAISSIKVLLEWIVHIDANSVALTS
jgi:hypothetical protein